jgi:hypothetical protein
LPLATSHTGSRPKPREMAIRVPSGDQGTHGPSQQGDARGNLPPWPVWPHSRFERRHRHCPSPPDARLDTRRARWAYRSSAAQPDCASARVPELEQTIVACRGEARAVGQPANTIDSEWA